MYSNIALLDYFFNDYTTGFQASKQIVNIIVSSLNVETYPAGWDIIRYGSHPEHIYFIKENGVTVINE